MSSLIAELFKVKLFRKSAVGLASRRGLSRFPEPVIESTVVSQIRVPLIPAGEGRANGASRADVSLRISLREPQKLCGDGAAVLGLAAITLKQAQQKHTSGVSADSTLGGT